MLKTTLAALVILGTLGVASATEFDGNLENKFPQASAHTIVSKPVALQTKSAPSANWMDQASQTFTGGGY